jgi:hypothetical protein
MNNPELAGMLLSSSRSKYSAVERRFHPFVSPLSSTRKPIWALII